MARNPELERALLVDPEDEQAYLVYADWLQAEGDPRGELITLMTQAERSRDPLLRASVSSYMHQHEQALLGTIEHLQLTIDGRGEPAFVWRHGFIHRIRLAYNKYVHERMRATVGKGWEPGELLTRMLSHDSARFVAHIEVGLILGPNGRDYQTVIDSLAMEKRPTVSTLHIGDFEFPEDSELSWTNLGYLGHMWPRLPHLRELTLQGGAFELGAIDLPELREATFRTCRFSGEDLRSVSEARWPALERLEIWFGDPARGACNDVEALADLLRGDHFPALRHLALRNAAFANDLAGELARAPLVAQLESLDLSMGTLDDVGGRALLAGRESFAHLDLLDVSASYLGAEMVTALAGLAHTVVAGDQEEGENGERTVSVRE
jgi:uncharacterized protein (TIGR02996 family)